MIGIFDSGIGGVTVLKEMIKELPNYHYIYYSDSIHNPYGDKSIEELNVITKNIIEKLISMGCKVIVIACNTASAMCKDTLRSMFSVPIIAIEPAIKMVYTLPGKSLVMATKGTLESKNFLELYHKYHNENLILCPCKGLADLIEQNKKEEVKQYLKETLSYHNIQNVVLGCTHYPLIKEELSQLLGSVSFYDGSKGVTKKLKQVLNKIHLEDQDFKITFYDSSESDVKQKRFYDILLK